MKNRLRFLPFGFVMSGLLVTVGARADPAAAEVRALIEANQLLQRRVTAQDKTIDELRSEVAAVNASSAHQGAELQGLRERLDGMPAAAPPPAGDVAVRLSGEVGLAFFNSGADGSFANGEFRVDDAKIFLESPIWQNVYFHSEFDLVTRESGDQNFHFGELYAEADNVSGAWNRDGLLSLRLGRMYIPFGEEYQVRGVMENPLIAHSISDLWGMDQGIEMYGRLGQVSYFFAVQDGANNTLHNFHNDKSLAVRIGFDPNPWLHLSGSAMQTGDLNPVGDQLSALWFGNGFFRNIGPAPATTRFSAQLAEFDAAASWTGGHLKAAGGYGHYRDNSPPPHDGRTIAYFYVEAMQNLFDRLYGAFRFSGVNIPGGYPVAGQGNLGEYFFGNVLTTSLYRASFGLGFQFGPPLVLKVDFSPEWGRTTEGSPRTTEDLFSTELGLKF